MELIMKTAIAAMALSLLIVGNSILCHGASEQVIYTFTGGKDGGNPYAGPILDSKGNLYGTTLYGGVYGYGAVFELSLGPDGQWTEYVLHSFNLDGQDGIRPYSSLVMDASGNLYGTTEIGGAYSLGTAFELSPGPNGWTEKILHSFNADGTDGYNPYANLILDTHGNLYSTTYYGGTGSVGTVFELSPNPDGSWKETIINNFDYTHGGEPYGGLVWDHSGNLYGTTEYGGDYQHGTVFELKHHAKGKWQEIVLHSFNPNDGDGFLPYGGLAIDKSNRFYGTTLYGGNTFANGAVFKVQRVKGVWQESVIHSFSDQNDGFYPYGPLAIDSAGRLYGTTWQSIVGGVGGAGIVFQLSRKKQVWQETILHQFVNPGDGGNPYSGVVLDSLGNIYGTTYWGGDFGGTGVVFEVTP
jgi:uncharacterized repeat protein (TIGR03803 family)